MAPRIPEPSRVAGVTPPMKIIIGGFTPDEIDDLEWGTQPAAQNGGAIAFESLTIQHEGVSAPGAFDHWLI